MRRTRGEEKTQGKKKTLLPEKVIIFLLSVGGIGCLEGNVSEEPARHPGLWPWTRQSVVCVCARVFVLTHPRGHGPPWWLLFILKSESGEEQQG